MGMRAIKNWVKENNVSMVSFVDADAGSDFSTCDAGGCEGLQGEVYNVTCGYFDEQGQCQTFEAQLSAEAIQFIEYGA